METFRKSRILQYFRRSAQTGEVNALVSAAKHGNIPQVRKLLAEGVPVDSIGEVSANF